MHNSKYVYLGVDEQPRYLQSQPDSDQWNIRTPQPNDPMWKQYDTGQTQYNTVNDLTNAKK